MRYPTWTVALAASFVLMAPAAGADTILLFDDFSGGAAAGAPSSGVTFTSGTAVLPSNEDGIDYAGGLFPSDGTMEVRVRVDEIGSKNAAAPGGTTPYSIILDSRGALGRRPGDIFVFVETDGRVRFTFNEGVEAPISGAIHQVVSTTSILDGQFHTVGIGYGSGGLTISIDGFVEDTDAFAQTASPRRFSLADYDEQSSSFPDSSFGFGFVGEVDWIRTSQVGVPEPGTLLLLGTVAGALLFRGRRSRAASRTLN